MFNDPVGYGIRPRSILDELLDLHPTPEAPRKPAGPGCLEIVAGRYLSPWPGSGVYPEQLEVECHGGELALHVGNERHRLEAFDEPVYVTEDAGTTVGFPPGGRFLMYDAAGIGLVSAWPYVRG